MHFNSGSDTYLYYRPNHQEFQQMNIIYRETLWEGQGPAKPNFRCPFHKVSTHRHQLELLFKSAKRGQKNCHFILNKRKNVACLKMFKNSASFYNASQYSRFIYNVNVQHFRRSISESFHVQKIHWQIRNLHLKDANHFIMFHGQEAIFLTVKLS